MVILNLSLIIDLILSLIIDLIFRIQVFIKTIRVPKALYDSQRNATFLQVLAQATLTVVCLIQADEQFKQSSNKILSLR